MENTETKEVAAQNTFKVEGFEFPGLAFTEKGEITLASLVDLTLVCLATLAKDNKQVAEILEANEVVIRDVDGKMYFPQSQNPGKDG